KVARLSIIHAIIEHARASAYKIHTVVRLTYHYKNCIHQAARTRYNMLQLLLSSLGLSLLSYLFILQPHMYSTKFTYLK
ncbi:hypothetical protein EJB05_40012, partial [Eragrostis curvula]